MQDKRTFYINGAWVAPASPRDCPVIDPSTEEPCATISLGDQADTDAAVAAAKAAFKHWSATPRATRRAFVAAILEQYEARVEEMAKAISLEMGAPIDLSRNSQAPCLPWHLKNFLTAFDQMEWIRPLNANTPYDRIALEPIGVVGLITPWNWPMNQVTLKVIPALLAGCTCVLKPSEESPLSSLLFAEFCHDAGLPPGVFNLVNGDGPGVGSQLSAHPDVEMISFTGSTRAGRAISVAAAQTSTESQPFSASGIYNEATRANAKHVEEAVATNTAAPDSKAAFSTLRDKIKQKQGQMSVAKRLVVNSALRKLEKMQAKKEIRKVEAAKKASGGLGEYKYPVILGAIGLVLVIIGAAAFSTAGAIFYVLGSLALTAAVIWAILILAEVI